MNIEELLPTPVANPDAPSEIANYQNLPQIEWNEVIRVVTKTALSSAFYLALIAIIIAGIYYLKSDGNEEDTNKAKDILLHLVFGAAVLSVAYGIISGLLKFNVF